MKENEVINKVANAEFALNMLLDDYNNLIKEYKKQTSFAKKIKKAVIIKKVDVAIVNILESTTKILTHSTLKNILSKDLSKHYNNLIYNKLTIYKNIRESVFNTRKSKILERKRRAAGERKKARNIKSTVVIEDVL